MLNNDIHLILGPCLPHIREGHTMSQHTTYQAITVPLTTGCFLNEPLKKGQGFTLEHQDHTQSSHAQTLLLLLTLGL